MLRKFWMATGNEVTIFSKLENWFIAAYSVYRDFVRCESVKRSIWITKKVKKYNCKLTWLILSKFTEPGINFSSA